MERLAGKVTLSWGASRWALAFGAGALAVLALAPFDFFAVLFISFAVLVWLLDGATGDPDAGFLRRLSPAFWTGWWFGFGYFVAGLWWLANALFAEGYAFVWALPLAVFGLPAMLAVFYGLAAALARAMWCDGAGRLAALAFAFGLAEWLRGFVFTGFPWNAIGYGAMPTPLLMQSSMIVGIYGMSALTVFVASIPALFVTRDGLRAALLVAALLVAAHAGFGFWSLAQPGDDADSGAVVRIVQPSVPQSSKWDVEAREEIFSKLLRLSSADAGSGARPGMIVWPETAVPFLLTENPDALGRIADMLQEGQVLLTGAVREENSGGATRYYNSILVIDDAGEIVAAADKVHLVPFGEYLPFQDLMESMGLQAIATMPGAFSAASSRATVPLPDGRHFLPLICYEVIFPDGVDAAGPAADFIVNVTNDAWYGVTPGPWQHFRQAQVRAVETGLPMIRAANNGISAGINARGQVLDGLLQNVIASVDLNIPYKRHLIVGSIGRSLLFLVILAVFLAWTLSCRFGFLSRSN
ncbi:MAG: apolipoprotein N-acyltransferase [Rhizobiaceae bacterium MnEN-MB40S]|nr:MAG: apolipoprotein N-acyltransferase [Rhizobiaceae bacterium MnEN-MB40S]